MATVSSRTSIATVTEVDCYKECCISIRDSCSPEACCASLVQALSACMQRVFCCKKNRQLEREVVVLHPKKEVIIDESGK